MGLDMYLNRVSKSDKSEVMYWRMANQIHKWIFDRSGVDPLYDTSVKPLRLDKDDVDALLADLSLVMASPEQAEKVMPTTTGFCFGETEYDEYYYSEICRTHKELSAINEDMDWENEWLEYSCWW